MRSNLAVHRVRGDRVPDREEPLEVARGLRVDLPQRVDGDLRQVAPNAVAGRTLDGMLS